MNSALLKKFSHHLKEVLQSAEKMALHLQAKEITPDLLFYGLMQQTGSLAAELIKKSGLNPDACPKILKEKKMPPTNIAEDYKNELIDLSPASKQALTSAILIAAEHQHKYIGTEHLLFALLNLKNDDLVNLLNKFHINTHGLCEQIILALKNASRLPDLTEIFQKKETKTNDYNSGQASALNYFTFNLTDQKAQEKIDPVFGREQEIDRLIQILSRRHKNNPVLLGEAGVGKTAIVEGLAKKIYEKNVPEILVNKKIYRLDLGLLIAGTMYRGEFENRLKQLLEEINNDPNIILFIDEIHNIVGTGSASGSMDAANILKPSLARGELRCIGATTLEEYRKTIENDSALERRFQPIMVSEPSKEKTLLILEGIKENYEKYHQVKINNEVLTAAIDLSLRFIPDRFLPDKAIDLIDEVAAGVRVKKSSDLPLKQLYQSKNKLTDLINKKNQAVKEENFQKALYYKSLEKNLKEKIKEQEQIITERQNLSLGEATKQDLIELVARITKMPVADLLAEEKNQLLNLENQINKKIIGQEKAIAEIAALLCRSRVGLTNQERPIASFLFLGPSGIGKTETAKVMAEAIFGSHKSLIRIDMSEYSEKFNISKLIGAPAGYIGYKENNKITDKIRTNPYSLVLFDEIEKAHPDVHHLLLQILDEGEITDATGRKINFKNTIIVLTSNIGAKEIIRPTSIGFQKDNNRKEKDYEVIREKILNELTKHFSPELLNRINKTLVFKPLTREELAAIARLYLKQLQNKLTRNQLIKTSYSPTIAQFIAQLAMESTEGARIIEKLIGDLIENELSKEIIRENIKKGDKIKINLSKNKIKIEKI